MAALASDDSAVINIERLNASIEEAVSEGALWPADPLLVTEKLLGEGTRSFVPMGVDALVCSEDESLVTVVIMRGTFTKAVGPGDWCEIHLRWEPDGTLRLCYVLPMNKTGARTRDPKAPLTVRPVVHSVQ